MKTCFGKVQHGAIFDDENVWWISLATLCLNLPLPSTTSLPFRSSKTSNPPFGNYALRWCDSGTPFVKLHTSVYVHVATSRSNNESWGKVENQAFYSANTETRLMASFLNRQKGRGFWLPWMREIQENNRTHLHNNTCLFTRPTWKRCYWRHSSTVKGVRASGYHGYVKRKKTITLLSTTIDFCITIPGKSVSTGLALTTTNMSKCQNTE